VVNVRISFQQPAVGQYKSSRGDDTGEKVEKSLPQRNVELLLGLVVCLLLYTVSLLLDSAAEWIYDTLAEKGETV